MRKISIFIIILLSFILICSVPAMATITQSDNSITDGSINVSTEISTFTIQLNSSSGTDIYVNLSLYDGTTKITHSYLTGKSNGTQSLTIPSLDGNTLYQIRINANDTDAYNNETYNFTTATKKLTDDTDNFSSGEILIIALITLVIILGFVVSIVNDLKEHKKLDGETLINRLVIVIFFVVVIVIIGSLI